MICDSSSLIFLAKIGKLELLKELFKEVIITSAIEEEILIEDKEGYNAIKKAREEKWIVVETPKNNMDFGLGKGETSAINLAKEKHERLIIDDLRAIKIAKSLGIDFMRTTDVLLIGLKKGLLTKKETIKLFNDLIKNKYYISPRVYIEIIKRIENF